MVAEVILHWTDDDAVIREEAYRFRDHPAPELVREIGTLVGGRRAVVGYDDPVWTSKVEIGPLLRTETALLRQRIGRALRLTFRDSGRDLADYPNAEIWWQASQTATLVDAAPKAVNADFSRGDLWAVTLQWLESTTGPIILPP